MVDQERRKALAFHLRQLSVGLTTNDDFENGVAKDVSDGWLPEQYYRSKKLKSGTDDPVIRPMLESCWGLYDDTRQHSLTKSDKLSKEALATIARCILFLRSDKEYEWPYFDTNNPLLKFSFEELLVCLLSFGYYYRLHKKQHFAAYLRWQQTGDYDVWPFFRKSDYEAQLAKPSFLGGRASCV